MDEMNVFKKIKGLHKGNESLKRSKIVKNIVFENIEIFDYVDEFKV